MRVVVEPDAHGRTSGGYLYNQRLAEHGAFELVRAPASAPPSLVALERSEPALILADSLFLDRERLAPFLELRKRGARVGLLLHAFPSFIERASDRAALEREQPLAPLDSEVALIDELELVVTPGRYAARLLAAAGSRTPCIVAPPGVDPVARRDEHGADATPVRLLVIANLTPAKGVPDALRALATHADQPWELALVGSLDACPSHVAALRAFVADAGLTERVHFRGALSHPQTLAELAASDVLLIPSYTENCPLVALEALRAGVPVVGYAVGGLPDLVESGVAGLLVPPLDVTALAGALGRVLEDRMERARLAAGAASAGAGLPSWADAAAELQRALVPYEK